MPSIDVIRNYISKNIPQWKKLEEQNLPKDCDLFSINSAENALFTYTNINITGTERAKPQIRVFLDKIRPCFEFAKRNNCKFFLFTIFTQDSSMATGLTAFDPHEFLVSLETNLDSETSRRDLRSLYDYVQEELNGKKVRDFIRCPQNKHNAGIKQASFIRIKEENVDKPDTLKKYVKYFDSRPYLESKEGVDGKLFEESDFFDEKASFSPAQLIYYGVPGCGKSFEVNKIIDKKLDECGILASEKEYHKVRCVFHPEYSNADFVGQIFPYVKPNNGGVEYRFKPGPFAEVIRRAFRNPTEPFFLVIEEINRGNAAAIFGEAFQLLDRIKPGDAVDNSTGNEYAEGWSSYGIDNIDVNGYIRQKSTNNPEIVEYDANVPYGEKIKLENYTSIRLPPNLSIFATMNTSDQNVIATDNAFQRRFKSRMIRNKLSNEVFPGKAQYDIQIDGTGVCWGKFRDWINGKILSPENGISKADDKCLGGWFISTSVKEKNAEGVATKFEDISREDFAEKVLKYLWDDVFKRNAANNIFNKDEFKSLSDLIDAFEEKDGESYVLNGFDAFDKIFKTTEDDKKALRDE